MADGFQIEPTSEEISKLLSGYTIPKAFEPQFTIDVREAVKAARLQWQALPIKERVKPAPVGYGAPYHDLSASEIAAVQQIKSMYEEKAAKAALQATIAAGEAPEFFPGYSRELSSQLTAQDTLERMIVDIQAQIQQVETTINKIGKPSGLSYLEEANRWFLSWWPFNFGQAAEPFGRLGQTTQEYNALIAQRNTLLDSLDPLFAERAKTTYLASLYTALPAALAAGTVESVSDIASSETIEAYPEVAQVFDAISQGVAAYTRPSELPPGEQSIDQADKVIAKLTERGTAVPVTASQLTVQEIMAALRAPETPPDVGTTGKEALEIFRDAGVDDETAAAIESVEDFARNMDELWTALQENQALIKAGLTEAKMPSMQLGDLVVETFKQPGLLFLAAFSTLYTKWTAPWGALMYRTWGKVLDILPGVRSRDESNFDAIYEEAKQTTDWWEAGSIAMQEASMGWANRLIFEVILDPLSWLGLGIASKITKPIPLLGKFVGAAERGWVAGWDMLIFDHLKQGAEVRAAYAAAKGWAKVGEAISHPFVLIPRTPMQTARVAASADLKAVAHYLENVFGGIHYRKIPLEKAKEALLVARKFALTHPEDLGLMGQAGRALLRRTELIGSDVAEMAARLGSSTGVTPDLTIAVNTILTEIADRSFGRALTVRTAPAFLLRTLGVPETRVSLRLARTIIDEFFDVATAKSNSMIRAAKNPADLLTRVYKNTQESVFNTLESAAIHNLEMSGRVAATLSRVGWKTMNIWRTTIDKWLVSTPARSFLVFGAFGPFNILEGYIKPAVAGINPFWKHWRVNPTEQMHRTWAGAGKPLELELGIPRMELAAEMPSRLDIEGMSSRLQTFRKIMSGGPLGTLFVDKPGIIGMHQRSNYWHRMALKFLGEEAPKQMQVLTHIIDDAVKALPDDFVRLLRLSRGELRQELLERTIAGPQSLRIMVDDIVAERIAKSKVSRDIALEDRLAASDVTKVISDYTQIPDIIQDNIIERASNGTLWAKGGRAIDETVDAARDNMYDYFTHSPEFYAERYKARAQEILGMEFQTREEISEALVELNEMRGLIGEWADDVLRGAAEFEGIMGARLSAGQWVAWRDQFRKDVYERLAQFADTSSTEFGKLVRKLKENPLDAEANRLLDTWGMEVRYTKNFVEKLRKEEQVLLATRPTKGKAEIAAFWTNFRAVQRESWNEWRASVKALRRHSKEGGNLYSEIAGTAAPAPPIVNAAGRVLTKMDIASIFHAHPSDLPASVLRIENMTLKAKDEFIDDVLVQARRMARATGKSAQDMGWTPDAIGEVYNLILRDMRMSPAGASVLEPRLMELASLKEDLWHIYHAKGLPEGTADKLQTFIDQLADGLEKTPGYAKAVPVPKKVTPVPKAQPFKYTQEWQNTQIRNDVAQWQAQHQGEDLWYHGAPKGMLPEDFIDGTVTKEFDEALDYALSHDGVVYVFRGRDKLRDPELGEKVAEGVAEVDAAIKPVKFFDVNKKYPVPVAVQPELPTVKQPVPSRVLSDEFMATKQRAADRASKEYYKDWADYTNENAFGALMRTIYPFWTYEIHRWFWLARSAIRTPGVFKAWGSYMNYTDDGYVHIPGTSLEANMLRGTIWMGGLTRLIRKDYPEYYDTFPGLSGFIDSLSRFGFYPASWVNFLKITGGTSASGQPMWGEMFPGWVKTPLNAFIALFPDSKPAKLIQDIILPEPFRDYQTMLYANAECQNRRLSYSGSDIFAKVKEGVKLTAEEESVWTRARQLFSASAPLMENAGILKIRTQEQIDALDQYAALIEEWFGYTKEMQTAIWLRGERLTDYVTPSPLQQAVLDELDALKYHTGSTISLYPSSWQQEDIIRTEFWNTMKQKREELFQQGRVSIEGYSVYGQAQLDELVKSGKINMKQWDAGRAKLNDLYNTAFEELASSTRYANVPVTFEDVLDDKGNVKRKGMKTLMLEREYLPAAQHPAKEILNMYYTIRLEQVPNPETGVLEDDWDSYLLQIDALIQALSDAHREDLVQVITAEFTPLTKLRWEVTREWFRPYNRRGQAILVTQYSDAEQRQVNEFYRASPTRRAELREVMTESGNKLISSYQADMQLAGENLRMLNPELDAWLLFFGKTDKLLTTAAEKYYKEFASQYGVPE